MTITPEHPSAIQIERRIDRLYDHLYANASVRTPRGIAREVGKVLHTGMFVELSGSHAPAFDFSRPELKTLEHGHSALALLVSEGVRRNFQQMNTEWRIYPGDARIELADGDLAYVCGALSGVLISDDRRDVFGDAIEIFRLQWAKRNGGQFFTDQRVTRLAMTLLQFDPLSGDDLVDICAGTGGFLLAGLNHIQRALSAAPSRSSEVQASRLALKLLKGQEADRDIRDAAYATLASRLGGDEHDIVALGNSLLPDAFTGSGGSGIHFATHRCAATNPPFGTKITIKDPSILEHYDLARLPCDSGLLDFSRVSPRAPDVLFIEQNIKLLQPGVGRLAIVIPYQIASGPQMQFVRRWLLRHAYVRAVIDLPADTFQPHTGTKACLLVVGRRETPLPAVDTSFDPPVFMSAPRWIGHSTLR